jgi:hypothetical protein
MVDFIRDVPSHRLLTFSSSAFFSTSDSFLLPLAPILFAINPILQTLRAFLSQCASS